MDFRAEKRNVEREEWLIGWQFDGVVFGVAFRREVDIVVDELPPSEHEGAQVFIAENHFGLLCTGIGNSTGRWAVLTCHVVEVVGVAAVGKHCPAEGNASVGMFSGHR